MVIRGGLRAIRVAVLFSSNVGKSACRSEKCFCSFIKVTVCFSLRHVSRVVLGSIRPRDFEVLCCKI